MNIKRNKVEKLSHHEQFEYAFNRPPYRQGRKLTAVKVYTVNNESQHLLIFGVPKIKLKDEVYRLASRFGHVKSVTLVDNYPQEDDYKFNDVFHLHYRKIQAARYAKKQLDERCFFGGILHVCYAPELETVAETRIKLIQRRRDVTVRIEANRIDAAISDSNQKSTVKSRYIQRSKKHPALGLPPSQNCDVLFNNKPHESLIHTRPPQSFIGQLPIQALNNGSNEPHEMYGLSGVSDAPSAYMDHQPAVRWSTTNAVFQQPNETVTVSDFQIPSAVAVQLECQTASAIDAAPNEQSVQEKKALKFLPRQIVKQPEIKRKRIVFYNK